jgi:hypothetical protein
MRLFFVPGTGHSEGVVLVLGPGFYMANPLQFVHPSISSGRVLRVDLDIYDSPATIVAVYGPAQPDQRAAFYSEILPAFLPANDRPVLLAGDFNSVVSENKNTTQNKGGFSHDKFQISSNSVEKYKGQKKIVNTHQHQKIADISAN